MRAFALLFAAQLRRDRWQLAIWIVGVSLLGFAALSAISTEFGDETDRRALVTVASANPAFLFLRGTPDGVGVGALVHFQAFAFTAVLAGFMNTFLVVRHSRADEMLGRTELVGSTPVSRITTLSATLALAFLANAALALGVAAGYFGGGVEAYRALLVGCGVGVVGLFFAATAALVAQLAPTGRMANGIAASTIGLAYFVRGIGDALGEPSADLTRVESAWMSLLSPIGWAQRSRPFSDAEPGPLVVVAVAALLIGATAIVVRARRDLGASLFVERRGPARGGVSTRSTLALAFRLQRGTIIGWASAAAIFGVIAGALGSAVEQFTGANDTLRDLIAQLAGGDGADVGEVFATAILGIAGALAAAAGIQAIVRLREEETAGLAEQLLATPASRLGWFGGQWIVAATSVVVVLGVAGLATGVSLLVVGDEPAIVLYLSAALAHAPAALVFVGLTGLVFGLFPRHTAALGWGLLVVALVLGQFGELLQLPDWAQKLSPFAHSSAMPVDDFDALSAAILVAVSVAAGGLAMAAIGRRNVMA